MALKSLPTIEGTTPQALLEEYAGKANLDAHICVHHYQSILKLQQTSQTPAKFSESDFQM